METHKTWSSFVTEDYCCIGTIYCRPLLRMAKMKMDWNLKK